MQRCSKAQAHLRVDAISGRCTVARKNALRAAALGAGTSTLRSNL